MSPQTVIRDETDADADVIGEVTEAAFRDLVSSDHTEQLIVAALRAARALTISLVAERDDQVVGHIAFSPVAASNGATGWFGPGPVSVVPQLQRRGIGTALIEAGLARLRAMEAADCLYEQGGRSQDASHRRLRTRRRLVERATPAALTACTPTSCGSGSPGASPTQGLDRLDSAQIGTVDTRPCSRT